jgi:hypothetical protein
MSTTLHDQVLTFPNIAKAIAKLRGITTAEARNEMCGVLVEHVRTIEREIDTERLCPDVSRDGSAAE